MPGKHPNATKTPHPRSRAWVWWMTGALILFGLIIAFWVSPQNAAQIYSFSTTTVAGEHISLDDYRGQVVMLNFWATWCPPCRAEMPAIETVYEQYRDQGFVVLAVNNAERMDQVDAFATQYGLTFPVLLDYSAAIQHQFGITGYPTSLFLDANGKVYALHPGTVTPAQLTKYVETGLQLSTS